MLLQQKVSNMRLNTDHFLRQQLPEIPDDVFKTMVAESDCISQIVRKCEMKTGGVNKTLRKRIEELGLDTTHFKTSKRTKLSKVDAIDDETFKMLVKNNTTWSDLSQACGFMSNNGGRHVLVNRIEKLGLNINHFDCREIDNDKIFVVGSQYAGPREIKKRLMRDFDRVYECAGCKNQAFTKSDGVLLWNNKEIVLQLEHKNGNHTDNRLENLEFLCPSCHSQTSTFTARNSKKHKAGQAWLEEGKTSHAPGSIASLLN
jgi:5-methylcytosine-specific restriction endonuclease McrA